MIYSPVSFFCLHLIAIKSDEDEEEDEESEEEDDDEERAPRITNNASAPTPQHAASS